MRNFNDTQSKQPITVNSTITRPPSISMQSCEREDQSLTIDFKKASEQYESYRKILAITPQGCEELPSDPNHPDCIFVEDTCIIIDYKTAIITRPGAASRRQEAEATYHFLERKGMTLHRMKDPATCDGGDVIRLGPKTIIVGLSHRTNIQGAEYISDIAKAWGIETMTTSVKEGLHLKCALTLVDESTVIYDPTCTLDLELFESFDLELIPAPEKDGANVLALGEGIVVVSTWAPKTIELLKDKGFTVIPSDIGELHKADGSLTCPSLRIPPRLGWCT